MVKDEKYKPRLKELYYTEIIPQMQAKFGYKNVMEVPKLVKICINVGIGKAKEDPNSLKRAIEDIRMITGQQPVVTKAKRAISNFKIKAGDPVGVAVTLRGDRMYEFLDRLITIALPRVRDFSGLSDKSFDGRGSYSLGLKEQIIFHEIDYDKVDKIRGMTVTITTNAKTDAEAYELLKLFGVPFKRPTMAVKPSTESK